MAYEAEKYALYNSNGLDLEDRVKSAMCYAMPLVADSGEMYDGFEMKLGDMKDFDIKAIAEEGLPAFPVDFTPALAAVFRLCSSVVRTRNLAIAGEE